MIGIGDIVKICQKFDQGFDDNFAFYPMGVPRDECVIHQMFSANMIGCNWRKYKPLEYQLEWTLIATFNVMQHFLY